MKANMITYKFEIEFSDTGEKLYTQYTKPSEIIAYKRLINELFEAKCLSKVKSIICTQTKINSLL
jgi:hypothetical protein